ncbi:hypothetical protein HT031_002315 [Scenedesmus sp. PABB004]|nr:hypothetical protein HT031_002315 [Scenedesmus sp. PABB004]
MQLQQQARLAAGTHASGFSRRVAPALRVRAQASTSVAEAPAAAAAPAAGPAGGSEIYIGFEKGDFAPRAGRKGRVIVDDPTKYPGKEDVGFLPGATGGWAGGEAGLWQLREQVLREKAAAKGAKGGAAPAAAAAPAPARPASPPAAKDGKAPIYLGYGKDELDKRKAGAPGRVILDDPAKYPAKDDLGPLLGATGGFAGGEKGLKQFVATGEVTLRDPRAPGAQQTSPVAVAGLLVAAGAGGGLLLNEVTDLGEYAVKAEIVNAPIDDKTKALLLVAVALLGGAGAVATGRALVSSLQDRISSAGDQASKLVIAGGFWLLVFLVARYVLELLAGAGAAGGGRAGPAPPRRCASAPSFAEAAGRATPESGQQQAPAAVDALVAQLAELHAWCEPELAREVLASVGGDPDAAAVALFELAPQCVDEQPAAARQLLAADGQQRQEREQPPPPPPPPPPPAHGDVYREARREALHLTQAWQRALRRSAAATAAGDRGAARAAAAAARELKRAADAAHAAAALKIEVAHNLDRAPGLLELDLHGLHAAEACAALAARLELLASLVEELAPPGGGGGAARQQALQQALLLSAQPGQPHQQAAARRGLRVITGKGTHSSDGDASLPRAVAGWLSERGFCFEARGGALEVRLKRGGGAGRGAAA